MTLNISTALREIPVSNALITVVKARAVCFKEDGINEKVVKIMKGRSRWKSL